MIDRLKEKSTWVGVITLVATVAGIGLAPEQADAIAAGAAVIAGLVLVAVRERKGDE